MNKKKLKIEVVSGVEGKSVYLDDFRIAGNKPWGGGDVVSKFSTTAEDVLLAIAESSSAKKKVYRFSYNDNYKVTIERTTR